MIAVMISSFVVTHFFSPCLAADDYTCRDDNRLQLEKIGHFIHVLPVYFGKIAKK